MSRRAAGPPGRDHEAIFQDRVREWRISHALPRLLLVRTSRHRFLLIARIDRYEQINRRDRRLHACRTPWTQPPACQLASRSKQEPKEEPHVSYSNPQEDVH